MVDRYNNSVRDRDALLQQQQNGGLTAEQQARLNELNRNIAIDGPIVAYYNQRRAQFDEAIAAKTRDLARIDMELQEMRHSIQQILDNMSGGRPPSTVPPWVLDPNQFGVDDGNGQGHGETYDQYFRRLALQALVGGVATVQ